jgi:copper oxidase (laccase) domain-containing protein
MKDLVFEYQLPNGFFRTFSEKPHFNFLQVKQIHSNIVVNEYQANLDISADGIIGTTTTPLCTLTADCLPIVVEGERGHAIVHAGWKGLRDQIISNELIKNIKPQFIYIGPHILKDSYEVQESFKTEFPNSPSFLSRNGKQYFDLSNELSVEIQKNYPNCKIVDANVCTFLDNRFHSFRKDKTAKRNYNIYFPNGVKSEN